MSIEALADGKTKFYVNGNLIHTVYADHFEGIEGAFPVRLGHQNCVSWDYKDLVITKPAPAQPTCDVTRGVSPVTASAPVRWHNLYGGAATTTSTGSVRKPSTGTSVGWDAGAISETKVAGDVTLKFRCSGVGEKTLVGFTDEIYECMLYCNQNYIHRGMTGVGSPSTGGGLSLQTNTELGTYAPTDWLSITRTISEDGSGNKYASVTYAKNGEQHAIIRVRETSKFELK